MDNIYERIEKVQRSFMRIMPRINSRIMNPGTNNPMMNFTISELRILQLFKEQEKYKMSEVANACGMPLPTSTHVVDKLVKHELVKRTFDEKDRRVIFIEVTGAGKKVIAECDVHHKESVTKMMSMLEKEDRERLVSTMEQFAAVMEEISGKMDLKSKEKEGGK